MTRYRALPFLVGILATLGARSARAQEPACSRLTTEAEDSVSARWPDLLETVHDALDGREDIDRCARVTLRSRNGTIVVEVVLPDARSASRSVMHPEDVVPSLEALLLLPRHEVAPETPRTPAPRTQDAPVPVPTPLEYDRPPDAAAPSHLQVELSVATGARVGDGQTSLGLGALSFLDLSGWLVGFEGRFDRYQRVGDQKSATPNDPQGPPDGASAALELAVLGGRRVRLGSVAFDFLVGPAAALQGTSTSQVQTQAGTSTQSSSSAVPRLLAAFRLNLAASATLHPFVGLDGELGPARAGGDAPAGAPRLPIWTLGLALGVTVGTR